MLFIAIEQAELQRARARPPAAAARRLARANVFRSRTMPRMRSAPSRRLLPAPRPSPAAPRAPPASGSAADRSSAKCMLPITKDSGLLISWPTPAASCPATASFSDWTSFSRAASSSRRAAAPAPRPPGGPSARAAAARRAPAPRASSRCSSRKKTAMPVPDGYACTSNQALRRRMHLEDGADALGHHPAELALGDGAAQLRARVPEAAPEELLARLARHRQGIAVDVGVAPVASTERKQSGVPSRISTMRSRVSRRPVSARRRGGDVPQPHQHAVPEAGHGGLQPPVEAAARVRKHLLAGLARLHHLMEGLELAGQPQLRRHLVQPSPHQPSGTPPQHALRGGVGVDPLEVDDRALVIAHRAQPHAALGWECSTSLRTRSTSSPSQARAPFMDFNGSMKAGLSMAWIPPTRGNRLSGKPGALATSAPQAYPLVAHGHSPSPLLREAEP